MRTLQAPLLAAPLLATLAAAQGSDDCTTAQVIAGTGVFNFDNSAATTDGVPDPLCLAFGNDDIENDVWFEWTAPTDSFFRVDTCGQTGVDTKIAVLETDCSGATIACNDDSCSLQSSVGFMATAGSTYMIRLGTFPGAAGGTGTFTITDAPPLLNPANGNFYLAVPMIGVLWTDAKVLAESMFYQGQQGYLATVTDQTENDFVWNNMNAGNGTNAEELWMGGFQDQNAPGFSEPGGGWSWVTGEPWVYSNWGQGEPNNNPAPEDFLIWLPVSHTPTGAWNDGLDNHWSIRGFIVEFGGSGLGTNYCASTTNSTGGAAEMQAVGSDSVAANNIVLRAEPVPDQPGIFYYGPNQIQQPFGNGFRCVGGTVGRLDIEVASGNLLTHFLDNTSPPSGAVVITPGSTWNFQAWYRDPAAGGASFNLSDAVELTFTP